MFRGVRLSSGAETQGKPVAFGRSNPLERADVAAAEDGRTPLNTYETPGYCREVPPGLTLHSAAQKSISPVSTQHFSNFPPKSIRALPGSRIAFAVQGAATNYSAGFRASAKDGSCSTSFATKRL